MSGIAANIDTVQRRMATAAQRVGRKIEDITLVAVTKTHPLATVVEAYQAGLRHFGENRVQRAAKK